MFVAAVCLLKYTLFVIAVVVVVAVVGIVLTGYEIYLCGPCLFVGFAFIFAGPKHLHLQNLSC